MKPNPMDVSYWYHEGWMFGFCTDEKQGADRIRSWRDKYAGLCRLNHVRRSPNTYRDFLHGWQAGCHARQEAKS